jgi:hypothetical protein
MRATGVSKKNGRGEVVAVCPWCLAAFMATATRSAGGLWALGRVAEQEDTKHKVGTHEEWLAARGRAATDAAGVCRGFGLRKIVDL